LIRFYKSFIPDNWSLFTVSEVIYFSAMAHW